MDELDAIEERKVTSAGNGKRRLTERLVSRELERREKQAT
jgi:hypothetical protein